MDDITEDEDEDEEEEEEPLAPAVLRVSMQLNAFAKELAALSYSEHSNTSLAFALLMAEVDIFEMLLLLIVLFNLTDLSDSCRALTNPLRLSLIHI